MQRALHKVHVPVPVVSCASMRCTSRTDWHKRGCASEVAAPASRYLPGGEGRRPGGTSPEQLWAVPAYGGLQWPHWFLHGCVCSAVAVSSQWGRARLMQWPGGGGRRPVTAPDCACAGDEACTSYAAINDPRHNLLLCRSTH
jgi:hypothetical protein